MFWNDTEKLGWFGPLALLTGPSTEMVTVEGMVIGLYHLGDGGGSNRLFRQHICEQSDEAIYYYLNH